MAERAAVLEFADPKHAAPITIAFDAEEIAPARLIPGSNARLLEQDSVAAFSEGWANAEFSLKLCRKFVSQLLPESLKLLHLSMLGTAVLDCERATCATFDRIGRIRSRILPGHVSILCRAGRTISSGTANGCR